MPNLTIIETFADGQVLFEHDLDNILTSVEDFFNITGIDEINLQTEVVEKLIQPGTVVMYGGSVAPAGWLLCDGAAVSRAAFSTLYGVIRDHFGAGDGSTTFNLPDCARRVPIGVGGSVISGPSNTMGSTGGEETHQLLTAEMPTHNHTEVGQHTHVMRGYNGSGGNTGPFLGAFVNNPVTQIILTASAVSTLDNTGSDTAHNNVQPSLVVTFIIKT